jgi:hypothetical protein
MEIKSMKSKIMFIALYSAAFMFPSIGSVDIADAETDISHCDAFSGPALAACVDAAHGSASAPFDDGLMGAPGTMGNARGAVDPCAEFAPATQSHESCVRQQGVLGMDKRSDANNATGEIDHCADFAPGNHHTNHVCNGSMGDVNS